MTAEVPLVLWDILHRIQEPGALDWRPFREGVEFYPIYGDTRDGPSAALLRYQPKAQVPVHTHTGYEHVLILSGSQTDGSGTYRAGTLVVNSPGSSHEIISSDGCVALVVWERPVCFDRS